MTTNTIRLASGYHRERAIEMVRSCPEGWIVTVREANRSLDQNARLWAMLSDISKQEPLGRKMIPDDWKVVFMSACGWEVQFLEGLDGRPFPMGFRTSKMTVRQMNDLLHFITAWGNENGILWSDPHE